VQHQADQNPFHCEVLFQDVNHRLWLLIVHCFGQLPPDFRGSLPEAQVREGSGSFGCLSTETTKVDPAFLEYSSAGEIQWAEYIPNWELLEGSQLYFSQGSQLFYSAG
jgi:hypothetical protein